MERYAVPDELCGLMEQGYCEGTVFLAGAWLRYGFHEDGFFTGAWYRLFSVFRCLPHHEGGQACL